MNMIEQLVKLVLVYLQRYRNARDFETKELEWGRATGILEAIMVMAREIDDEGK